ncbi:fasciclin domain-containing protein [Calothrix sp. CCY 0018]|uniref:fasciclin domain-containing protein n=1 Tax=Calothrix sp. CCY 0018 TaxID=3103864 RepID=UPI0039C67827
MKRMLSSKKAHSIGLIMILSVMVSMATACSNEADNTVAPTQTATPPAQTAAQPTPGTIVEIAAGDSSFSTLVTAVKAAGLAETLSGEGPFTVFAPTDEAFAALPEGTLDNLLKPENRDSLRKVLTYHVVSGDLMAKDLNSGQVATVEGSPVEVQVSSNGVKVNNANVAKADIDATNGVIHVIDSVLLPPGL